MPFQEPMLLGLFDAKKLNQFSHWFISEKFDGWRGLFVNGRLMTRHGKPIKIPQSLADALKPFSEITLDGEVWGGYTQRAESEDNPPEAIPLEFRVFDAPDYKGEFEARYNYLQKLFENVSVDSPIKLVPQIKIAHNDIDTIDSYFQDVLKKGGEGVVLRPSKMDYKWNTRYQLFMKKKPWDTLDVEIIGYYTSASKEEVEGYISSYVCKFVDPYTGKESDFRVTCRTFSPLSIGSIITIKYSQWTADGLPKFPSILGTKFVKEMTAEEKEKIKNSRFDKDGKKKKKVTYSKPTVIPPLTKTLNEWIKNGGYEMKGGEKVGIYGSTGKPYIVTCSARDFSYYCSCQAWMYQSIHPRLRTCKHIIAVHGVNAEKRRIAVSTLEIIPEREETCINIEYKYNGKVLNSNDFILSPKGRIIKRKGSTAIKYLKECNLKMKNGIPTLIPFCEEEEEEEEDDEEEEEEEEEVEQEDDEEEDEEEEDNDDNEEKNEE